MLFLYVFILISTLWGARLRKEPTIEASLSVKQGTMLKGIFVMLVLASHVGGYMDLNPSAGFLTKAYLSLQSRIGQLVVLPFLFYSGYGLRCSIEKKGKPYLRTIPTHRILRIYLHAVLIISLFFITTLFLGNRYSWQQLLAGYLLWRPIGNSTWYIFAIIFLYFFTWLTFSLFRNQNAALAVLFLLIFGYCIVLSKTNDTWYYDTVFVFFLGMLLPDLRSRLQAALQHGFPLWIGAILLLGAAALLLTYRFQALPHGLRGNVRAILVMLLLLLLLERVEIGNRLLFWIGSHVFEFYMLQRLPMILMSELGLNRSAPALFVALSILCAAGLSFLFGKLLRRFDRLVFRA